MLTPISIVAKTFAFLHLNAKLHEHAKLYIWNPLNNIDSMANKFPHSSKDEYIFVRTDIKIKTRDQYVFASAAKTCKNLPDFEK